MGRYSRNDGIVTDGTTGGWLVGGSTPPIPILRPTPVPSTFPRPPLPSPHRPVTLGPPWQILPAGNKSTFYLFGR